MDRRRLLQANVLLFGLSSLLACGTAPHRELESITLSPAIANGSAVQFTATGHWSTAPAATTPLAASWGVCRNDVPSTAVAVSPTGAASCTAGAHGTYTVFANHSPVGDEPVCNVVGACGGGCQITGSAQLTCP